MRWINAAAQLACLFLVAAVTFPMCFIGVVAGIVWTGLAGGFRLADDVLDWVTGEGRVWGVRVRINEQETPR